MAKSLQGDGTKGCEISKDKTKMYEITGSLSEDDIPGGLSEDEANVYKKLIKLRKEKGLQPRPIVVITDIGKDYDDLVALVILKEFHRLQLIDLQAVVVNLMPADTRTCYARVVMESLGLGDIPVACGTRGSPEDLEHLDYEFSQKKFEEEYGSARLDTMDQLRKALRIQESREVSEYGQEGQDLLRTVYEAAKVNGEKLYLLLLSSLQDIEQFSSSCPDLVAEHTAEVIMQGGNSILEGHLVADGNAANNRFDMAAAGRWHSFIERNALPSRTYTKIAAFSATLSSKLFEDLEATGHPIGANLRRVQLDQDLIFYKRCCESDPKKRFQPFMDQMWFLANKTNWEGQALPVGEEVIPYLTKIVLYDVHAALGVPGIEVEEAVDATKSEPRKNEVEKENGKVDVHHWISSSDQSSVNLEGLLVALSALMKGSLLAVQQSKVKAPLLALQQPQVKAL